VNGHSFSLLKILFEWICSSNSWKLCVLRIQENS